jgi:hypothetical protein
MHAKTRKFRELILYVAKQCEADPKCGATKLNKILFYSDFRAYEDLGAAISGEAYQKLENGPAPKRFVPVVRDLEEERACIWADRRYHGKNLRKLIALREPDLSVFKPAEIDLVRDIIEDLWDLNATEVSDLSHRFVGWQAADLKEEIPYNTVFVDDPRPLSAEEHEWALQVIGDYREREEAAGRQKTSM